MKMNKFIASAALVATVGLLTLNVSHAQTTKSIVVYPIDVDVDQCVPVRIVPTTEVSINLNLDAREATPKKSFDPTDSTTFNYLVANLILQETDPANVNHHMRTYFIKSDNNQWVVRVYVDDKEVTTGSLIFDVTGKFSSTVGLDEIHWNNSVIKFNLNQSTMYATDSQLNAIDRNGWVEMECKIVVINK